MGRLIIFIGKTVFGWAGWWLGSKIGPGITYLASALGTFAGICIGWRIHRDFLW